MQADVPPPTTIVNCWLRDEAVEPVVASKPVVTVNVYVPAAVGIPAMAALQGEDAHEAGIKASPGGRDPIEINHVRRALGVPPVVDIEVL